MATPRVLRPRPGQGTVFHHNEGSTVTQAQLDAELRLEQDRLDVLYARLDELRAEADLSLNRLRRAGTAGTPAARVERDAFVLLQSEQLERIDAVQERLCLGRLDLLAGGLRYIGRMGLTDADGTRLLIDWRAPAAQPFYRATAAEPDGVISRRHLTTAGRRVTALSDEVLDLDAYAASGRGTAAVGSDGALMLSLNAARTGRMRDIVATIQSEQDRIIRAPLAGVLVVQGGPGTGKTVVALHRAAYLLYAHRDRLARTGVLIVGPNSRFLHYIEQVLPSLGETGVAMLTPGQLYPGIDATGEDEPAAAVVKGRLRMINVLKDAVKLRQRTIARPVRLLVEGTAIELRPADVDTARHRAQQSRRPHNVARGKFIGDLLDVLAGRLAAALGTDVDGDTRGELINALRSSPDVRRELNLCWMPLSPERLLRDLYADPARLGGRRLSRAEQRLLQRDRRAPWTPADVALLDEAAELLGEIEAPRSAAQAQEAEDRAREVASAEAVLDSDPDAAGLLSAQALADRYAETISRRSLADHLAHDRDWGFGHVVVDEAQELSAMQWRVLMRRCPGRSMTVVGDPAQTGSPAGASDWRPVLDRYVRDRWRLAELTVNYRTPGRIMDAALDALAVAGIPATPVQSARAGDGPPVLTRVPDGPGTAPDRLLDTVRAVVAGERDRIGDGQLAVIVARELLASCTRALAADAPDVSVLTPGGVKGLEFDGVVLVDPAAILAASERGANDLYVAMTRCTQRLHIVYPGALPAALAGLAAEPQD